MNYKITPTRTKKDFQLLKDFHSYDYHNLLKGKHELQHNFACEKLATKMINKTYPIIRKVFYAWVLNDNNQT